MNVSLLKFVRRLFDTPDCPAEQQLAEYADRQLIGDERHAVEGHLAQCDTCAEQVAFLVRAVPAQLEPVPDELLRKAVALGKTRGKGGFATWRPVGVGALALLLLVAVVSWQLIDNRSVRKENFSKGPTPEQPAVVAQNHVPNPKASPDHNEVRGSAGAESRFFSPLPGNVVDPTTLVFRWKPFADVQFYEVELVSDDGTVIWQQRAQSASVPLPTSVHLAKGKNYFVRLRVHSVRGSVEQTRAVGFIVE